MKNYGWLTLMLLAGLFTPHLGAQSSRGTDIFLADLSLNQQRLSIGSLTNITNRHGYDNQPHFLPDNSKLFYTSAIDADNVQQMDALQYDLQTGVYLNLTNSSASEYSPTFMPDGNAFSVIRVGADGKQKFWSYPLNEGKPKELLADIEPVGYHAWVNPGQVLLFVLADIMELQLADISTGRSVVVDTNIGPSLFKIPGSSNMSYTKGNDPSGKQNSQWHLYSLNTSDLSRTLLTTLPEHAYYYTWTADGKVLAAQQSRLLQWNSHHPEEGWQVFADISASCPRGATRLATSPDQTKLAIVCNR